MRLIRLHIHRLPGVRNLHLEEVAPAVNVVTGPNASGKSSILRAVRALLYPELHPLATAHLEAEFEDEAGRWKVARTGESVEWSRDGAPIEAPQLPDGRFLDCYTLRLEDLAAGIDSDREIAGRLASELMGGYDLESIRSAKDFSVGSKVGHGQRGKLKSVARELAAAERRTLELSARERDLPALRRELEESRAAAREAGLLEGSMELAELLSRQQVPRGRLRSLPSGLAQLAGDEWQRLEEAQGRGEELARELERARTEYDRARSELLSTGLADSAVSRAQLDEANARLQRLEAIELRLDGHLADELRARERVAQALGDLGADPRAAGETAVRSPLLDPASLSRLNRALDRRREAELRLSALKGELELLDPEPDVGSPEELRRGRDRLEDWLTAAEAAAWGPVRFAGLVLTVLAFSLTAAPLLDPAIVASAVDTLPVALGESIEGLPGGGWPVPVVVFLGGLLLLLSPRNDGRRRARRAFEGSDLAPPVRWRKVPVRTRLDELRRELARAELDGRLSARRRPLAAKAHEAAGKLEEAEEELRNLSGELGFEAQAPELGLQRWFALTAEYDRGSQQLATVRAEIERARSEASLEREPLLRFLGAHGEGPIAPHAGAAALRTRLESLTSRLARRESARQTERDEERRMVSLRRRIAENRSDRHAILTAGLGGSQPDGSTESAERVGVDEREAADELRRRLQLLPEFRRLTRELAELKAQELPLRKRLAQRPDLVDLAELGDAETLRERRNVCRQRAQEYDGLLREIAGITTRVEEAQRDRRLEELRGRVQLAEDELHKRYQEALYSEAGRLLLDDLEREHTVVSRPRSLLQAEKWFGTFTRGRYTLRFRPDSEFGFYAFDLIDEEERRLGELSTGTRAQLLLAVRIAFALEVERGRTPLPLFLDEALTTADAQRFRAVTRSLRALAEERQIFYLSARPEELALWTEAAGTPPVLIDVASLRSSANAIEDYEVLAIPQATRVPAPHEGEEPERYAHRLAVPALDPWAGSGSVHAFHLLRDDLSLLHRMIVNGQEHLGTIRAFLQSPSGEAALDLRERQRLAVRCRAAQGWLDGWRVGRGRPVDRWALEGSQAVSETFMDRVCRLAEEVGGDARSLLERLSEGAVKSFQTSKREELAAWLADNGYLDERQPISARQLRSDTCDAVVRWARQAATGEPEVGGGWRGTEDVEPWILDQCRLVCEWLELAVAAYVGHGTARKRNDPTGKFEGGGVVGND